MESGVESLKINFESNFSSISLVPPTGVPSTGVPHAKDSGVTSPKPSKSRVGKMKKSAAL